MFPWHFGRKKSHCSSGKHVWFGANKQIGTADYSCDDWHGDGLPGKLGYVKSCKNLSEKIFSM